MLIFSKQLHYNMNVNVKVQLHSAKANVKAKSLPDGLVGNPFCPAHRATAKTKENFRFGIRFRLVWVNIKEPGYHAACNTRTVYYCVTTPQPLIAITDRIKTHRNVSNVSTTRERPCPIEILLASSNADISRLTLRKKKNEFKSIYNWNTSLTPCHFDVTLLLFLSWYLLCKKNHLISRFYRQTRSIEIGWVRNKKGKNNKNAYQHCVAPFLWMTLTALMTICYSQIN